MPLKGVIAIAASKKVTPKLTLTGRPNPKQEEFFNATTRFVGYGGSRGGG